MWLVRFQNLKEAGDAAVVMGRSRLGYANPRTGGEFTCQESTHREHWRKAQGEWKIERSDELDMVEGVVQPTEGTIPPESPRLLALLKDWQAGYHAAADVFWQEVNGPVPLRRPKPGGEEVPEKC